MSDTLDVNVVRSQITHLEGWGKWDELEVKLMRKMFLTLDEEIDRLKARITLVERVVGDARRLLRFSELAPINTPANRAWIDLNDALTAYNKGVGDE